MFPVLLWQRSIDRAGTVKKGEFKTRYSGDCSAVNSSGRGGVDNLFGVGIVGGDEVELQGVDQM